MDEAQIQALVDPEHPKESAHQLNALKLKVKATGNPYLLAHLLSHLGTMQALQSRYEEARETLNEADYVLIEAASRDKHESPMRHRAWLRYYAERARFFAQTGWGPSARSMASEAQEMARATGHFDLFKEITELRRQLEP